MLGLTKVFLKTGVEAKLEKLRDIYVDKIIVIVQSAARGCLGRLNYKKLQEQLNAIKLIQDNWRTFSKLRSWSWWELFTRSRPQVDLYNQEQERLKKLKAIQELKDQIQSEKDAKAKFEEEKKKSLQQDILKLQAEIESQNNKGLEVRGEMDKINDKYRELEGTIDQYKREKQLMVGNKDKLLKDIKKKEKIKLNKKKKKLIL